MTRPRLTIDVSGYLLEPEQYPPEAPLCWQSLFGTEKPVEIEIGSGKGLFLASAGTERPGHNFLGIELSRKYARLAAQRVLKRGLANVRVWPGDARPLLARRVPDASVHAVHVYFPDPWWKKRHKKRRVFSAELVASVVRVLEPAGALHVATDVQEYFGVITALLAAEPLLREQPVPPMKEPEHDLDYLTNFERKFRIEGRDIYRASYMKPPAGEATAPASSGGAAAFDLAREPQDG
jgi:tRNA (guanine-N7-)-methyltransferase